MGDEAIILPWRLDGGEEDDEVFIMWKDLFLIAEYMDGNSEISISCWWDARLGGTEKTAVGIFKNPDSRSLCGAAFGVRRKTSEGHQYYFFFFTEDGTVTPSLSEDKYLTDRLNEGAMVSYEEYVTLKEMGLMVPALDLDI